MQLVVAYIEEQRAEFTAHPMLARLECLSEPSELRASVPALGFWVLMFQDVLRINERRMKDPELCRYASRHRREDSGHDAWFLADLRRLGVEGDLGWLFGDAHEPVRMASYEIMAEVLRTEHDSTRIALLHAFEAASMEFFIHAAKGVDRVIRGELEFFGRRHLEAEQDHEMWDGEQGEALIAVSLDDDQRSEAVAVTDRVFAALTRIMDHLDTLPLRP